MRGQTGEIKGLPLAIQLDFIRGQIFRLIANLLSLQKRIFHNVSLKSYGLHHDICLSLSYTFIILIYSRSIQSDPYEITIIAGPATLALKQNWTKKSYKDG